MVKSPDAASLARLKSALSTERQGFASGCLIAAVVVVLVIVGAGIYVVKSFKGQNV